MVPSTRCSFVRNTFVLFTNIFFKKVQVRNLGMFISSTSPMAKQILNILTFCGSWSIPELCSVAFNELSISMYLQHCIAQADISGNLYHN